MKYFGIGPDPPAPSVDPGPTATVSTSDPAAFVAEAQRITNEAEVDDAVALFHPDCVAEWTFDGIASRYEGIDEIRRALTITLGVFRDHQLAGSKTLVCSDEHTIVNTWRGGFHGSDRQTGIEIWGFRDGLVIRHEMAIYLHATSRWSPLGLLRQLRLLVATPRIAISQLRHEAAQHPAGLKTTPCHITLRRVA